MFYIETGSLDPTYNLALEEYCQKKLTELPHIMMLWQNENAIIIGRYQNAEKEVNLPAARQKNARIVRRSTGGGTVYHDLGNINYSFINTVGNAENLDFRQYVEPMVAALNRLGIPAKIEGRNDILLGGKKISGTAQNLFGNRLLSHGTLLYDSDLQVLQDVLNADPSKIQSKGVSSVKNRVSNIKAQMGFQETTRDFWKRLLSVFPELEPYQLSEEDIEEIKRLQKSKYLAWDWQTGNAPAYVYSKAKRFPGGKVELRVRVEDGYIRECRIEGDFLGLLGIGELEKKMIGVPHAPEAVREAIQLLPLKMYLGDISAEQFLECMFDEIAV